MFLIFATNIRQISGRDKQRMGMESTNKRAETSRKKVVKRSIPREVVPLDEKTWLLQPMVVSIMRYDYDVVQTRALVAIIQEMQDAIQAVMFNKSSAADQLSLFDNSDFVAEFGFKDFDPDKEIAMKIPLRNFGSDKRRYDTLKMALKQLVSIPVEIPITSLKGDDYTQIKSLCEAFVPEKPYSSSVYIKIEKQIALRMIGDKTFGGVHKYLKDIVFDTRNKYVQRLYMFLSSWKRSGETCTVTVIWLRKMLRLEDKYPRWDMFYSKVIRGAEEELKEKSERGESDFYFTTQKIYKYGQKRGEPDELRFFIHKSVAGELADEAFGLKSDKIRIGDFAKNRFGIKGGDLKDILSKVNMENSKQLMAYLTELDERERVAMEAGKVKDLRRHAFTCIIRKLSDWQAEKEEQAQKAAATILSEKPKSATEASAPQNEIATKAELCTKQPAITPEEQARFAGFVENLRGRVGQGRAARFSPLAIYSFDGKTLCMTVPNKTLHEIILNEHLAELNEEVSRTYGEEVRWELGVAH